MKKKLLVLAAAAVLLLPRLFDRLEKEDLSYRDSLKAAWNVYWDNDIDPALSDYQDRDLDVMLFAAYFDENDRLHCPDALDKLRLNAAAVCRNPMFLSFTNDVQHADGTATQKSPELLCRLFADEEALPSIASDMVAMAKEWRCAGVELDFENLGKDMELWLGYERFIALVTDMAESEGLWVRVVLPVTAPVDQLIFDKRVIHSVMCYNLYGTHSGPGPKANIAFLENLAQPFANVPQIHFALANGGFVWDASGVCISSITTGEAEAIAAQKHLRPRRDKASGALHYTYFDKTGQRRIVWYADGTTLSLWTDALRSSLGREPLIDLWRLE